jgi:hypothetical protein
MSDRVLILDALSAGSGQRRSSRDSIGCGPRSVAGIFERHNIQCRIYRVEEIFEKRTLLRKFDHVAISAMTMDFPAVSKFVKLWRGSRTQGRILIGGPISADPQSLNNLTPDAIVIGEGEATLEELVTKKFFEKYPQLLDLLASVGTAWEVEDKNPIVVLVPYKGMPEKDMDWLILGIDKALRTAELLHKRPEIIRLVQSLGEKLLNYYTSRNITSIEVSGPTILFKSGDIIEGSLDSLVREVQSMLFQRLMREYKGGD